MSHLRYNEKELASFAISEGITKEGLLQKLSKKSKQKFLWLILKCNLLFVYKLNTRPSENDEAHSCYILEECFPTYTETGFQITFSDAHKKSGISFLCSDEESEQWVNLINQSNFRYLRHSLEYYQSILDQCQNAKNGDVENDEFGSLAGSDTFSMEMRISLQNVRLQQTDCLIFVQVFKVDDYDYMMIYGSTHKVSYRGDIMVFYNSITITSDEFNKDSIISFGIFKFSQSKLVAGAVLEYVDVKVSHILVNKRHRNIIPINGKVGPNSLLIIEVCDTGALHKDRAIHHNHRSSCLFSDHIQPLPFQEKLLLFENFYDIAVESSYRFPCNTTTNTILARELIMEVTSHFEIARNWIQFIISVDKNDLGNHESFGLYITELNDKMLYGLTKLEYRLELYDQHLTYLTGASSTKKAKKKMEVSMYVPNNLSLYRLEIFDRDSSTYDVLDKVTMNTSANYSNGFGTGGLYTMFCNESIVQTYNECQALDKITNGVSFYNSRILAAVEDIAIAAANSNVDQLARHFKDFEVLAHSIIGACSTPQVADMILNLAENVGSTTTKPLFVWERNIVVKIDPSWSIATTVRHLHHQLKVLSGVCNTMCDNFMSELWVDKLFIPCNDLTRNLISLSTVAKLSLDYKIFNIQNKSSLFNTFTMRCDAVLSQFITGVITSFYSCVFVYMDDVFFWLQLLNVGFFVQVECLLSCSKAEIGIIEDVHVACELMKNTKIEIIAEEDWCKHPSFSGSRYNLIISIPVNLKVYALLLDICQGHLDRKINLLPCLFVQGIDKQQTKALSIGEVGFQTMINTKYFEFFEKILDKRQVFYNNLEDELKFKEIMKTLHDVKETLELNNDKKSVQFISYCQKLGRSLCAGQITCCNNGIDRTSMSVTYEMYTYLEEYHDLDKGISQLVLDCLRQGCWLTRIYNLRGQPYYNFSSDKRSHLPKVYQPPVGTFKSLKNNEGLINK